MKLSPKVTAMLSSYGRSFLAAAVALWTTGNTDPKPSALKFLSDIQKKSKK